MTTSTTEAFEDRLRMVLDSVCRVPSERVPLRDGNGRVLASDVIAQIDSPRFDNSAVDGYAISERDLLRLDQGAELDLRCVGVSRAGEPYPGVLTPGTTVQTMTGAALANGTVGIVMQEDTERTGDYVTVRSDARAGHIRRAGEDYRAGRVILPAGTRLTPPAIAVAAGAGEAELLVYVRPRVAILATGDELAAPGEALNVGEIYESNTFALRGLLGTLPVEVVAVSRVGDDEDVLRDVLERLLGSCDVLVTTGGVSVGAFDRVRSVLGALGVDEVFWRAAIKPGKPVWFGTRKNPAVAVFGLPGNPMSAIVTAALFIGPFLRASVGLTPVERLQAFLAAPLRSNNERTEFVASRLTLDAGRIMATPIEGRSSHLGLPLVDAQGWVVLPARADFEAGSLVEAVPAPWATLEYPGEAQ
ncbi:MAG TPA: molybdopterin molybdotransferase MoeA [Fimbriimonadaceae bacterium]|nr:molybdopterin molybdotransferase MoeA [Fimbriimonadaceae bacterium]HRJ96448.1 molybdopterin molybdotransferase MoeA [Fimbriimonadaceae bacterium]